MGKKRNIPFDTTLSGQELTVKSMSRGGSKNSQQRQPFQQQQIIPSPKKQNEQPQYNAQGDNIMNHVHAAPGLNTDGTGFSGFSPDGTIAESLKDAFRHIEDGTAYTPEYEKELMTKIFQLPMMLAPRMNQIYSLAAKAASPHQEDVFYYNEETKRIGFKFILNDGTTGVPVFDKVVWSKTMAGLCLFFEVFRTMGTIEDKKGHIYLPNALPYVQMFTGTFIANMELNNGKDERILWRNLHYKAGVAWATIHYTKSNPEEICEYVESLTTDIF